MIDGTQQPRTSAHSDGIVDVRVDEVGNVNDLPRNVNIEVTAAGQRAQSTGTITSQTGDVEFLVQGNLGSATINIQDGTSVAALEDAINSHTNSTGIEVLRSSSKIN